MIYYIDANIFIYATNTEDPRHLNCKRVLEQINLGAIKAVTSVETFEEIIHYSKRIKSLTTGLVLCNKLLHTPLIILPFTLELLEAYLKLVKIYSNQKIESRDIVHVASALRNQTQAIISADQDFDKIKEIKRIDPKEFTDVN